MRLTSQTDYALRVLLFAGAAESKVTISQVSTAFGISMEHLRKVVHALAQHGYLCTTQGRNGGITLGMPAERINIREVVERFEPLALLECFDAETNTCPVSGMCALKHALYRARNCFLDALADYHLSDIIRNPRLVQFARQPIHPRVQP